MQNKKNKSIKNNLKVPLGAEASNTTNLVVGVVDVSHDLNNVEFLLLVVSSSDGLLLSGSSVWGLGLLGIA